MVKLKQFIAALLAGILLVPAAAIAHTTFTEEKPLKIYQAHFETDDYLVKGEVKVCNNESERIRTTIEAKNMTINSLYKRNVLVPANKCQTYKLYLHKNFAEMSNAGDEIRLIAKYPKGLTSFNTYRLSEPFYTEVEEGNNDPSNCGDEKGDDGFYSVCVNDFIYHEPSGLRIKVKGYDRDRAELLITHVQWGGVKKKYVYKGRSKKIISGDEDHTRVRINNVLGDGRNDFILELESWN